jgi:predicted transposase YbfD/YdcC
MSKLENKERILKAPREKHLLIHKGKYVTVTSDLSAQTLKVRKTWSNVIQVLIERVTANQETLSSKDVLQPQQRNKDLPG